MSYICIDFEFYKNEIALMQINFETDEKYNYIWLNNPKNFTQQQIDIFVKILLTNDKIYKILHGSESNDIPYLYNNILIDKQNIINFTRRLIDTRYLCEYAKYGISQDTKCSLYYALLFFSVINKQQFDYLENINKKMGPIQYIRWDLYKMNNNQIYYALYDVLYLKSLVNNTYKYVTLNHPEILKTYKYIPAITRFIFLERMHQSHIIESIKYIDKYNTYLIKHNDTFINIIDVYTKIYDDIFKNLNIDIEYIYSFGYIKKYFSYLIKYTIYDTLCYKHMVYTYNKEKIKCNMGVNLDLNMNNIIKQLELYRCKKIVVLIKYIKEYIYLMDNLL
jgi:hypothetical protein